MLSWATLLLLNISGIEDRMANRRPHFPDILVLFLYSVFKGYPMWFRIPSTGDCVGVFLLIVEETLHIEPLEMLHIDGSETSGLRPSVIIVIIIIIIIIIKIKIKSVAYSSQGKHTGQLDFCN